MSLATSTLRKIGLTAVSTALVSLVWLGLSAQPVDAAGAMYPDAGPVAAYRYSGIGSCVVGPGDGGVVVGLNRNGAPSCSKSLGSITVGALTLDQYGTGGVDLLTDSNNNVEVYPSSGGSILLSGPVGGIYTDAGITAASVVARTATAGTLLVSDGGIVSSGVIEANPVYGNLAGGAFSPTYVSNNGVYFAVSPDFRAHGFGMRYADAGLVAVRPGYYLAVWSVTAKLDNTANGFSAGLMINGANSNACESYVTVPTTTNYYTTAGSCVWQTVSGTDVFQLGVSQGAADGVTTTIKNASLTVTKLN